MFKKTLLTISYAIYASITSVRNKLFFHLLKKTISLFFSNLNNLCTLNMGYIFIHKHTERNKKKEIIFFFQSKCKEEQLLFVKFYQFRFVYFINWYGFPDVYFTNEFWKSLKRRYANKTKFWLIICYKHVHFDGLNILVNDRKQNK